MNSLIIDEPVRGQIPPPWFWALPGSERIEALAQGFVPLPPLCRLLGIRPAHIGPASGSWTMPASPWFQNFMPPLVIEALAITALQGTGMSVLAPGSDLRLLALHVNYFRPTRAQSGNLVARARVLNANPFFLFVEALIEDPQGRRVLEARGHARIEAVTPPPPRPPEELRRVEEPRYSTPDPCLRRESGTTVSEETFERGEGMKALEALRASGGGSPLMTLLGLKIERLEEGRLEIAFRASPWFSMFRPEVDVAVLTQIISWTTMATGQTQVRAGTSMSGLAQSIFFNHSVPADGRRLLVQSATWADGTSSGPGGEAKLRDEAGGLAARCVYFGQSVDAARRRRPQAAPARRTLYTLLFTDVVDSTKHLERLGDAKWRETLGEQQKRIRAEIGRYGGTEVDTQGDSFFIRFSSPAQALACARAVRGAVRPLGIEIRAGLHTGECEEQGNELAGLAVHLAARIQGKAGASEIWVSNTLKDLVAGSGLRFEDRGENELKGIEGAWRLWALEG